MRFWILGLCLALAPGWAVAAEATTEHDWLVKHPTIVKLVELTNQHRARMGRPPVRINADMCLAAQRHATNMADTGWYRHSGLPWPEIIYAGPRSESDAVNGWINSPAHHGIMLSGTEVGFGYMVRNGQPYWVGLFR
ncbi:MAG: CAP domain-containing protein [Planctomycetaceae bacterium]|nr:CAP domain-containing protein [Planctomycetaceae bacterium]